jgi:hypothetical protein
MRIGSKGQALNAIGIVTLAVGILIGALITGNVYSTFVGDSAATTMAANVETTINSTMTQAQSGFTLLAVAIIVGAAVFILAVLGGR